MTWSWSHTNEAYENARENLADFSRDDLNIIYAEIRTSLAMNLHNESNVEDTHSFNDGIYSYWVEEIKSHAEDKIIDFIWSYVSEDLRTCDNGGFNAWLCPYGCHTTPFDRIEKE